MAKKVPTVGIIAEADSDVDSARVLIHRIANNDHIGVRKHVGNGCGKLKRKCRDWSKDLKEKGCSRLVLIHDLDGKDLNRLSRAIQESLYPLPIRLNLICIPVQEFEAWFLSDPQAIQSSMHLKHTPAIKAPPETIDSPKEYLGELIHKASVGEKIYISTKHNVKISQALSIALTLNRCPSFIPFYNFIRTHF